MRDREPDGRSIEAKDLSSRLELIALATAVGCTLCVLAIALVSPPAWARLGREDGVVEAANALALLAFSATAAWRARRSPAGARAPSAALTIAGLLGAGEEVSWGQRLFGIEPPSFFLRHNAQGEMNLHNLLPPPWDGILAAGLICGLCAAPFFRRRRWAEKLQRHGVPWPRVRHAAVLLICLFLTACLFAKGVRELEELGELVIVLCLMAVAAAPNTDH